MTVKGFTSFFFVLISAIGSATQLMLNYAVKLYMIYSFCTSLDRDSGKLFTV